MVAAAHGDVVSRTPQGESAHRPDRRHAMRKPLIAVLGLMSLVFLSGIASADLLNSRPFPIKLSKDALKKTCDLDGGTFNEGGAVTRGYRCKFKDGETIECNKEEKCIRWK
jgi:hypothetical protein